MPVVGQREQVSASDGSSGSGLTGFTPDVAMAGRLLPPGESSTPGADRLGLPLSHGTQQPRRLRQVTRAMLSDCSPISERAQVVATSPRIRGHHPTMNGLTEPASQMTLMIRALPR